MEFSPAGLDNISCFLNKDTPVEILTFFLITCGRYQDCVDGDGEHLEIVWNYIIIKVYSWGCYHFLITLYVYLKD